MKNSSSRNRKKNIQIYPSPCNKLVQGVNPPLHHVSCERLQPVYDLEGRIIRDRNWMDEWERSKLNIINKLNKLFKLGIEAYSPVWLPGAVCKSRGVSSSSLFVHQVENSDHLLLLTERERSDVENIRCAVQANFTCVLRAEEAEPSGRSDAHLDLPSLAGKSSCCNSQNAMLAVQRSGLLPSFMQIENACITALHGKHTMTSFSARTVSVTVCFFFVSTKDLPLHCVFFGGWREVQPCWKPPCTLPP